MRKAKKVLALTGCAALLVVGSVAGTVAYLTSQDEAVNNFTVGQVKISLDEADVDEDGQAIADATRVQSNDYHLLPGLTYDKDPMVHIKAGSEDCYARMYVTITHDRAWNTICDSHKDDNGNNLFGADDMFVGLQPEVWNLHEIHKNEAADNTRTYEFWYNKKITNVPEKTNLDLNPLFQEIKMPDQLTNEDLALLADNPDTKDVDEGFKIYVVAQAIQAASFDNATEAFAAAPPITGINLMPGIVSTTP